MKISCRFTAPGMWPAAYDLGSRVSMSNDLFTGRKGGHVFRRNEYSLCHGEPRGAIDHAFAMAVAMACVSSSAPSA